MFPFYGFVPIGRRFTIDTASEKINTAHFSYIYIAKIAEEVRTNTWRVVLKLVASWFNTMGCHWGVQREHKVTCLTCSLRSLRPVWGCSLRSLRPVPFLCSLRSLRPVAVCSLCPATFVGRCWLRPATFVGRCSLRPATFWWVSRRPNFFWDLRQFLINIYISRTIVYNGHILKIYSASYITFRGLQICRNVRSTVGMDKKKKNLHKNPPKDHTWRPWVADIELPQSQQNHQISAVFGCFRYSCEWILVPGVYTFADTSQVPCETIILKKFYLNRPTHCAVCPYVTDIELPQGQQNHQISAVFGTKVSKFLFLGFISLQKRHRYLVERLFQNSFR